MVKNDIAGLIEIEATTTLASAAEGTTLSKLTSQIEKRNVVKVVTYLTTRLADNFNVGKKFSVEQASIMAMDLLEVFNYETIEDVVLMFRYARQGKIGDGKDFKLDSQTVFHKWVPEYLELKAELREQNHNKQKNELLSIEVTLDDVKATYTKAAKAQMPERVKAYVDRITKDIDRPALEKLIEEWAVDEVKKPYLDILKRKRIEIKSE